MNMGFGFSEFLLIALLVLVFFGSKELPAFVRTAAKWLATLRRYTAQMQNEIDLIARPEHAKSDYRDDIAAAKKRLRREFETARAAVPVGERHTHAAAVAAAVRALPEYASAAAVMLYVSKEPELDTRGLMEAVIADGKALILPRCAADGKAILIARVRDVSTDLEPGSFGIAEPKTELCGSFFKSDIGLILCPGLAFDRGGRRLGRGAAYYDRFLAECTGRVPLVGISYACQLSDEALPADYHDVSMDVVITEAGVVRVSGERA